MRRFTVTLVVLSALTWPGGALAGGWWSSIQLERTTVAPGQEVQLRATQVMFASLAAAREARETPFYVYVLRGFDDSALERAMTKPNPGEWWELGRAEAIRAGRVELSIPQGSNLGTARARFRVPDLPAGAYTLMLCDAGCRHSLADLVPVERFRVVADPVTAALVARVERLEQRADRLAGLRASVDRRFERAAARDPGEVELLRSRIASLERELRTVDGGVSTGWLVGAILLAALAGMLVARTRPLRPAQPPAPVPLSRHPLDGGRRRPSPDRRVRGRGAPGRSR